MFRMHYVRRAVIAKLLAVERIYLARANYGLWLGESRHVKENFSILIGPVKDS